MVDDGSTDNSVSFMMISIRSNAHQTPNKFRCGAASNTALENSKGDYFVRVDSDDYISSELVSTYAPILDHNQDIDFVYGDLLKINQSLEVRQKKGLIFQVLSATGLVFFSADKAL